ncbi:hypothetical protein B0H14DRAFT_3547153 [Mycena olivaceomarginata]|nr:hypothetical protein B0H14DRAFT_3547153 [Mycena olivaceomarginata]
MAEAVWTTPTTYGLEAERACTRPASLATNTIAADRNRFCGEACIMDNRFIIRLDFLLLKSPPGPTAAYSVSERMPTGGALLWFIFHVRSSSARSMPPRYQLRSRAVQCMRHFTNRSGVRARTLLVELLLGENTSHAIASRGTIHDSLDRRGPHALLPRPPRSPKSTPASAPRPPLDPRLPLWVAAGLACCRTVPNELAAQRL